MFWWGFLCLGHERLIFSSCHLSGTSFHCWKLPSQRSKNVLHSTCVHVAFSICNSWLLHRSDFQGLHYRFPLTSPVIQMDIQLCFCRTWATHLFKVVIDCGSRRWFFAKMYVEVPPCCCNIIGFHQFQHAKWFSWYLQHCIQSPLACQNNMWRMM